MNAVTPATADLLANSTALSTPAFLTSDAELVAAHIEAVPLIADYTRLGVEFFTLPNRDPDLQRVAAAMELPGQRLDQLIDRATELRAMTLEGWRAKALLLQHDMGTNYGESGVVDPATFPATYDRLGWSLAADLLAMSGNAPPPPPLSADAELLALCATFQAQHAAAYDDDNETWEEDSKAKWETFGAIQPIAPTTEAGHRAKAEVAVAMLDEVNGTDDQGNVHCPAGHFAVVMLRGWLGQGASA